MKFLNNIRELIWPLLGKCDPEKVNKITDKDMQIRAELLDFGLEQAMKIYQSEEERRSSVESKSSLFIGTMSVVITIIIGVNAFIHKYGELHPALLILSAVLIIYMSRTIWFSVQALERKSYETITFSDINLSAAELEYKRNLIITIINKTKQNSVVINEKVNSMVMAQEYFKRVIGTIVAYIIVQLGVQFLSNSADLKESIQDIFTSMTRFKVNNWNIIVIYSLILISLFFGIYAFYHLKKKK